ncbi:MAG: triose-phosphate isomerase, partial [Syntrophobacterales bacterium]
MRRPIIAGNWKMNKTVSEAVDLVRQLKASASGVRDVDIVVAPPFTALGAVSREIKGSNIELGAQDIFWEPSGAYTGEVSATMLKDVGCRYVIIGHSERRQYFGEKDESVQKKIKASLGEGLLPIVCVGEALEAREA